VGVIGLVGVVGAVGVVGVAGVGAVGVGIVGVEVGLDIGVVAIGGLDGGAAFLEAQPIPQLTIISAVANMPLSQ
jgi:hypothetical protein